MATATTENVVVILCKAFSGELVADEHRCIVEEDGTVRVYDRIAGYYTRCHSMSKRNQDRVRKAYRARTP